MAFVTHPFPPLYDSESRILILGSFPSVKSREQNFFYGHPQNRFWRVTAAVFDAPVPRTVEEKKAFLHANHIALWDVIASCEIEGSSDASIRNVTANDLSRILDAAPIERIYTNGATAHRLYCKYIWPADGGQQEHSAERPAEGKCCRKDREGTLAGTPLEAVRLPSTSPANAAWSPERLIEAWRVIAESE